MPTSCLSDVLWKVFFALTIIIGVVAWLFVLAQQSRRAAEEETRRQTTLLIQEIDAHKRTDAELQRAKEVAESANLAKSRYVVGPEPRTALAAERHLRLCATAGAGRQPAGQTARPGARGPPQRRSSVGTDRRHSGHFQDRGRPALSVARRGAPERFPRSAGRHVPPAGRGQGHRLRVQAAGGAAASWSMPTKNGCARS